MDISKSLISDGDSLILILSIIHPAYLGHADDSWISISIFLDKLNYWNVELQEPYFSYIEASIKRDKLS